MLDSLCSQRNAVYTYLYIRTQVNLLFRTGSSTAAERVSASGRASQPESQISLFRQSVCHVEFFAAAPHDNVFSVNSRSVCTSSDGQWPTSFKNAGKIVRRLTSSTVSVAGRCLCCVKKNVRLPISERPRFRPALVALNREGGGWPWLAGAASIDG